MRSHLLVLLALVPGLHAQEAAPQTPNPFVKKGEAAKTEKPPGQSYTSVVEHILVPPDDIAAWMRGNSVGEDAEKLRSLVQGWIDEGKATLEHTVVATGVADRKAHFSSIVELIYPTTYEPAGTGVWPLSTAFETRNTGLTTDIVAVNFKEGPRLAVWGDHVAYAGSRAWDILSNRTKHPDDIFMPDFRSARATWGVWQEDPPNRHGKPTQDVTDYLPVPQALAPDKIQLLARIEPPPEACGTGIPTRLVFLRGGFLEPAETGGVAESPKHLAYEMVEVPQAKFSAWHRSRPLAGIASGAWDFVEGVRKNGEATTITGGDGMANGSAEWRLESIYEQIYPTEYMPSNKKTVMNRWEEPSRQSQNGKSVVGTGVFERYQIQSLPGLDGKSLATSFETRNAGFSLELTPSRDESGLLMKLSASNVVRLGDTVSRRIEVDGEWVPDCTMPLFTSNSFETTCRIPSGKWTLVGSGSRFTGLGKTDSSRCMLFFVKLE
ncbi:hypothetical protein OJ996_24390 [Luteolibacter sp. GHJ8]|uniref:Uncharacterized protein n=1 Tax=Luteolibacter rhizosphaerae TaxID=2989719 RepID=A0ABT3GAU9_9BACT|nr:hypothetical protein [Luteolibacter rhizosphaerae]MCW1916749.1 hypothetical protein [Luteolibacter rhizosphaerae]